MCYLFMHGFPQQQHEDNPRRLMIDLAFTGTYYGPVLGNIEVIYLIFAAGA